jgi:hypothetical protein
MQIVGGYQTMDKASPLAFRQALMSPYLNGHLSLPLGGQAAAAAAAAAAASAAAASGATSPGNAAMTNLRLSPTLSNRSSEESLETNRPQTQSVSVGQICYDTFCKAGVKQSSKSELRVIF